MFEKRVFFLFSSSRLRKDVQDTAQSYLLCGMDLAPTFDIVPINDFDLIDASERSTFKTVFNRVFNSIWVGIGGYGGDWWKVLAVRKKIKSAEWVLSQVDRVGIPLVILSYLRIIPHRKILYISIGLPVRLKKLSPFMKRFYLKAFSKLVRYIVCYGYRESVELSSFFSESAVEALFVPFGVDTKRLSSTKVLGSSLGNYLISVGRDGNRDYEYLRLLSRCTSRKIYLVSKRGKGMLAGSYPNVVQCGELPFEIVIDLIRYSRAVILPVKNNSYSGATTTLMLSFALGKAVFVTVTDATKKGYGLRHMHNCVFLSQSDGDFLRTISEYLENDRLLTVLGENARKCARDYYDTYGQILRLVH